MAELKRRRGPRRLLTKRRLGPSDRRDLAIDSRRDEEIVVSDYGRRNHGFDDGERRNAGDRRRT